MVIRRIAVRRGPVMPIARVRLIVAFSARARWHLAGLVATTGMTARETVTELHRMIRDNLVYRVGPGRLELVNVDPWHPDHDGHLGPDGVTVTLTGTVADVEHRMTHQGRPWLTATLRTGRGSIPLLVWAVPLLTVGPLTDGQSVTLTGRVDRRGPGLARVIVQTRADQGTERSASTSTPLVMIEHNGTPGGVIIDG